MPSNTNSEENYALEEQSRKPQPLSNKDKSTICQKQQQAMAAKQIDYRSSPSHPSDAGQAEREAACYSH